MSEEGEDLSDLIPTLEKKFARLGLTIKKDENTFKSTFEIFEDLSKVWDNISDMDRAGILEDIAGKRNANVIAAVIGNFEQAQAVMSKYNTSAGSAWQEHKKYAEGVDFAYNNLLNTVTELNQSLLKSETLVDVLDMTTAFVGNAAAIGKFNIAVLGIVGTMGLFTMSARKAILTTNHFNIAVSSGGIRGFASGLKNATLGLLGFKTMTQGTTVSMTALNVAMSGMLLGLPLLAQGIGYLIRKQKESLDQNILSIETLSAETKVIDEMVTQIESLHSVENKNAEQKQELITLEKRLADILPKSTTKYDEQNNALATNLDLVKQLNDEKKQQMLSEATAIVAKLEPNIDNLEKDLKKYEQDRDAVLDAISRKRNGERVLDQRGNIVSLEDLGEALDIHNKKVEDAKEEINTYESALNTMNLILGKTTDKINANSDGLDNINNSTKEYADTQKVIQDSLKSYLDSTNDLTSALDKLNKGEALSLDTIQSLITKYPELLSALQNENGQLTLNKKAVEKLAQVKQKEFKDSLINQRTDVNEQANILKAKLNNYGIEIDALDNLQEARKKALMSAASIDEATWIDKQFTSLKGFKDEIDGLQTLINTDMSANSSSSSSSSTSSKNPYEKQLEAIEAITDELDLQNELLKQAPLDEQKAILDKINVLYTEQKEALHELNEARRNDLAELLGVSREVFNDMTAEQKIAKAETLGLTTQYYDLNGALRQTSIEWHKVDNAQKQNIETMQQTQQELKQTADDLINNYLSNINNSINEEIDSLKKLKEKAQETYQAKIDAIQLEIDNLEKRNDLLREEEERQNRLRDLADQRTNISNIEKERNTKIFQDGKFVLIADPRALREEQAKLQDMQEEYNSWEIENQRSHELQRLQDSIDSLENELKKKEDLFDKDISKLETILDEQERLVQTSTENQITSWDNLIAELDKLGLATEENLGNAIAIMEKYNETVANLKSPGGLSSVDINTSSIKSSSNNSNPLGMSSSDYQAYLQNKKDWENGNNQTSAASANQALRAKYNIPSDTYSYNDLKSYSQGGVMDYTGLAKIHGSKTSSEIAFNASQAKELYNLVKFTVPKYNMDNLISKSQAPVSTQSGDNFYLSNFTIQTNDAIDVLNQFRRKVRS